MKGTILNRRNKMAEYLLPDYIDYALDTGNKELFNELTGENGLSYLKISVSEVETLIDQSESDSTGDSGSFNNDPNSPSGIKSIKPVSKPYYKTSPIKDNLITPDLSELLDFKMKSAKEFRRLLDSSKIMPHDLLYDAEQALRDFVQNELVSKLREREDTDDNED